MLTTPEAGTAVGCLGFGITQGAAGFCLSPVWTTLAHLKTQHKIRFNKNENTLILREHVLYKNILITVKEHLESPGGHQLSLECVSQEEDHHAGVDLVGDAPLPPRGRSTEAECREGVEAHHNTQDGSHLHQTLANKQTTCKHPDTNTSVIICSAQDLSFPPRP